MGLSLERKLGQGFVINDELEIIVMKICKNRVRLLVLADPDKYKIMRREKIDEPNYVEDLRKKKQERNAKLKSSSET